MPKNKGKGGKNRRRGKNENDEKRELVFKEDGQGAPNSAAAAAAAGELRRSSAAPRRAALARLLSSRGGSSAFPRAVKDGSPATARAEYAQVLRMLGAFPLRRLRVKRRGRILRRGATH